MNDANLIILFVVIPIASGIISLALTERLAAQRTLGVFSLCATALLALRLLMQISPQGDILVSQMGQWAAPFGISVVFDSLSGLLLLASSVVALGCYIHSFSTLPRLTERQYYHPLIQFLMFGVNLSFLTGDLFNLFVAFEIMLMASYALLTIGASRQQMRQAYKYVMLNLLGSVVFVTAAGMVYGLMGTLNYADLARIVAEHQAAGEPLPTGFTTLSIMLLFVFGLKGAFFPLWFWLPDTYHTVPISVGGLFSGMLTKVGVYSVLRTFPLIFAVGEGRTLVLTLIGIAAAFTMFLGVLGAVSNHRIRRILAVHVISQVGYMVFGLAVMTGYALAGVLFYMIQHMVVKSSLFLCCGLMERYAGSDDLDEIGGLVKRDWLLATLFLVAALSLVGLPPLSGFFGKLVIVQSGWESHWWLSIIGLLTGALTLLSMLKIWSYGFWGPPQGEHQHVPAGAPRIRGLRAGYVGAAMLVVVALGLGFAAEPVYRVAFTAGAQLEDPAAYVNAVLGEGTLTARSAPPMPAPALAALPAEGATP